jgi:cytochrome c-type biogenesis protein CcmH
MMRLAVALAAIVACCGASGAVASEAHPTLAELEHEVMCPTCHTTLDVSQAPAADRIRAFIRARIAAGDAKSEIERRLVSQFGDAVLAEPPRRGFGLLAWVVPVVAAALGAVAVGGGVTAARRAQRRASPAPARVDPRLEALLDQELGRFDL